MNIVLEQAEYQKGRTFSQEAIYTFAETIRGFLLKGIAVACRKGFDKNQPVHKVEFRITALVNDKEVDLQEMFDEYPDLIGFDMKYIKDSILKKED